MKYFIAAGVVSLMAASAYAGGMPEELIEPTKIAIEAMDASPDCSWYEHVQPF